MRHKHLLRRIDGHLERSSEIMARSDKTMAHANELMAENRDAFKDLRTYLRELTRRSELAFAEMLRRSEEQRIAADKAQAELLAKIREGRRVFVEEQEAQRQALFRILAQLDGHGGPAVA